MLMTREEYYGHRQEEAPFNAAVVLICISLCGLIIFITFLIENF